MSTPVLVIARSSRALRRQLGALAWCVLEELALGSAYDGDGFVAAVGVRDIAGRLGITKDTAARAISALAAIGIVVRDRVEVPGGRARSGYRLFPPDGVVLARCLCDEDAGTSLCHRDTRCPPDQDGAGCQRGRDNMCPVDQDGTACPSEPDSACCPTESDGERRPNASDIDFCPVKRDGFVCPNAEGGTSRGSAERIGDAEHLSQDAPQRIAKRDLGANPTERSPVQGQLFDPSVTSKREAPT